jgi:copper chaperone
MGVGVVVVFMAGIVILDVMARSSIDIDQPSHHECLENHLTLPWCQASPFVSVNATTSSQTFQGHPMATTHTTTFQVQGMTCGHCERAVTQAVQQIDPTAQVRIDRASGKVDVDSTAPREALVAAIAEEGYTVAA